MNTVKKSSPSIGRPFDDGTMFARFRQSRRLTGPAMLFAAGSPARTSAMPGKGLALKVNAADYGINSHASLAFFDQNSLSWKMLQPCLFEGLIQFSANWPRSGMTRNGQLFRRAPWVRHTHGKDCSLLPTPRASRGFTNPSVSCLRDDCLTTRIIGEPVLGMRPNPEYVEWMMGFPIGWCELKRSETPSSHKSQNGLADE